MNIIIAGDLVPTKSNYEYFSSRDMKGLLGSELHKLWKDFDVRIFNLEAPITDSKRTITKSGPSISAPTEVISGIKELNPSGVCIANNHILDRDFQGLQETIDILNNNGIKSFGAGINISEASKPFILNRNGISVGVYACAEHEFSIATHKDPGANPYDPLESMEHMGNLRDKCDYVIVLYHGGKEYYRYPSPSLQKAARRMVDKGADLVICQHSHCIGTHETYKNASIVYGQGNFIFDRYNNDFWNTSILVSISIEDEVKIKYIPIVKNDNVIKLADTKHARVILDEFNNRATEISKPGFIQENYERFASEHIYNYLRVVLGWSKWKIRIDKYVFKGKLIKRFYTKIKMIQIKNYIECEAHRELLLKGLDYLLKEKE